MQIKILEEEVTRLKVVSLTGEPILVLTSPSQATRGRGRAKISTRTRTHAGSLAYLWDESDQTTSLVSAERWSNWGTEQLAGTAKTKRECPYC
jgi:hypothetical protein